ncbi:MAG: FAD-binding oxidoreductase [Promethearchaeia archaeon]
MQKYDSEVSINQNVIQKLIEIVGGKQFISTDIEVRANYSRDMTEQKPEGIIDVVVLPDNEKQVEKIVKLAYKEEIPVIPYAAGANIGGLTLPPKEGGITIDFKRMRDVVKIDRENKYIVVEPGFTFGDLKRLLDTKLPNSDILSLFRLLIPLWE